MRGAGRGARRTSVCLTRRSFCCSISLLWNTINCFSKVVQVGSGSLDKHIVVYALRDLQVGEELQYDYQFALGGEKIECHCGAPNCWGRMN